MADLGPAASRSGGVAVPMLEWRLIPRLQDAIRDFLTNKALKLHRRPDGLVVKGKAQLIDLRHVGEGVRNRLAPSGYESGWGSFDLCVVAIIARRSPPPPNARIKPSLADSTAGQ